MVESWKVEQTCVTGPSPVMDSSAPCANYEARREWAEKECQRVSACEIFCTVDNYLRFRLLINQKIIHFYLVLKNLTKQLYERSILNAFMMLASMLNKSLSVSISNVIFLSVVIPAATVNVCAHLFRHLLKNVNQLKFLLNGVHKTSVVSDLKRVIE